MYIITYLIRFYCIHRLILCHPLDACRAAQDLVQPSRDKSYQLCNYVFITAYPKAKV